MFPRLRRRLLAKSLLSQALFHVLAEAQGLDLCMSLRQEWNSLLKTFDKFTFIE